MSDLVKRLRIKAGMIEMGEMIAWGSDSALMREAADALEMVAPAVQGEPVGEVRLELGAQPYVFAELCSKSLSVLAPGTKLYAAPQPAPDMVGLVEALRTMLGLLQHKAETPLEKEAVSIAETAIAAHRKQGGN